MGIVAIIGRRRESASEGQLRPDNVPAWEQCSSRGAPQLEVLLVGPKGC